MKKQSASKRGNQSFLKRSVMQKQQTIYDRSSFFLKSLSPLRDNQIENKKTDYSIQKFNREDAHLINYAMKDFQSTFRDFSQKSIKNQKLKNDYFENSNQIDENTNEQLKKSINCKYILQNPNLENNINSLKIKELSHFGLEGKDKDQNNQLPKTSDKSETKQKLKIDPPKLLPVQSQLNIIKTPTLQFSSIPFLVQDKTNEAIFPQQAIQMNKTYQHNLQSNGINKLPIPDKIFNLPQDNLFSNFQIPPAIKTQRDHKTFIFQVEAAKANALYVVRKNLDMITLERELKDKQQQLQEKNKNKLNERYNIQLKRLYNADFLHLFWRLQQVIGSHFPGSREFSTLNHLKGKIYLFGGQASGNVKSDMLVLDPKQN